MGSRTRVERKDPHWPEHAEGEHVVSELVASRQGSLSPFGEQTSFPLPAEELPYVHPVTVINK